MNILVLDLPRQVTRLLEATFKMLLLDGLNLLHMFSGFASGYVFVNTQGGLSILWWNMLGALMHPLDVLERIGPI